jgi:hypothetical protein
MTPKLSRRRRPLVWSAFVAVLAAVFISAVPGTASAATQKVTPLLDCYQQNSDGSVTVVLGYSSTYTTTKTFTAGSSSNYSSPSSYNSSMPTSFAPGAHHLVLTLRLPPSVVYGNPSWTLDGTTLNYLSMAQLAGTCTPSQLPAMANGAALAVGLVVLAGVGVLVVRLVRRNRAAVEGAPRA